MSTRNSCTFYIVRHGETDWNAQHLIQGHSDISLNANGELQAKELAEELKDVEFDMIFSSDLMRAKKTAEIIALEKRLAVVTTEILRERRFGRFEGVHVLELKEVDEILKSLDKEARFKFRSDKDAESDKDLINKLIPFIREVAIGNPKGKILIVSHGGVLSALIRHIEGVNPFRVKINNLGYIVIESDGVEMVIKDKKGVRYEN